jgi:hypothetical protein
VRELLADLGTVTGVRRWGEAEQIFRRQDVSNIC